MSVMSFRSPLQYSLLVPSPVLQLGFGAITYISISAHLTDDLSSINRLKRHLKSYLCTVAFMLDEKRSFASVLEMHSWSGCSSC